MDSTGALELKDIPKKMLIIGGGIIGLEMGTVYDALGSSVSIVELTDGLIQGCDRDIVRPLHKRMGKRFEHIWLGTKVTKLETKKEGILVHFEGPEAPSELLFDRVLVAVGRKPNGHNIDASKAGVKVDDHGFIATDKQMRTNVNHIYAIGDIVGQPMLAHKATHEGKIAAEVIAGEKVEFQALTIPSVAYTDPEIAWAGVTEDEAKEKNIAIEKSVFPWAASGRAISTNRTEGMTKLIFDIGANIFSVTSFNELRKNALDIERWNRLNPDKDKKVSHIEAAIKDKEIPIIASTDYMKSFPEQIARFLPNRFVALGTDGYGRSDSREALRSFFEVDRYYIVITALTELANAKKIDSSILTEAIKKYMVE